jgi:hypothetical protein
MDINEAIDYVNGFFVNKIINKEYCDLKVDRYKASFSVQIDVKKYSFTLWICSGWFHLRTYSGELNFMDLSFTDEQKKILHERFNKIREEKIEAMKKEEYERLKKEFELKNK